MGRGAPNKKGLDYFPKMVDFYEDDRIFDLLDRYGPLGVTVYDCILCIVYRHGYYAEIPLDKLSRMITRMIGNKWVKNKKAVAQVVHYCSEIGLIDDDLMTKNIITSVGIQKRFYKIAVKLMKRQLYDERYWLLDKEEKVEPLLNAPKNGISSEEHGIISEINPVSSEEAQVKEKKNKIEIYTAPPDKPFDSPELEQAFQLFLVCRERNGENLTAEQRAALRNELWSMGDDDRERIAVANKAVASGWKSFYPVKRKPAAKDLEEKKRRAAKSKNRFNNFQQRENDYKALERMLLEAQAQGGDNTERNRETDN